MKNVFKKIKIKNKLSDINRKDKNRDFVFSDDIFLSRKGRVRNYNSLIIDQTQIGIKQYIENNIENTSDSFVVEDTDGLYFDKFSQNLEDKGYCVKTINFKKEIVNVLSYYDPFADINSGEDITFLVNLIISSVENAPYLNLVEEDSFWLDFSTALLNALICFVSKSGDNNFENLIKLLQKKDLDEIHDICEINQGIKALDHKTLNVVVENCYYKVLNFKNRVLIHINKNDVIDLEQRINHKTAIFLVKPICEHPIIAFSNIFYYFIYSKIKNIDGNSIVWRFFLDENNYNYNLLEKLLIHSSSDICVDLILKNLDSFQHKQRDIYMLDMFNQVILFGGQTIESNVKYVDEIMKDSFIYEIFSVYSEDKDKDIKSLLRRLKWDEFILLIKSEKIAVKDRLEVSKCGIF